MTAKKSEKKIKSEVLLDKEGLSKAIDDLAKAVHEDFPELPGLMVLGIRTRGMALAERLCERLNKLYGSEVPMGVLDITFYRDDLNQLGPNPSVRGSELPLDVQDSKVILVDDVLYTGRTIRAAMDEICDFGRPGLIRLAVLVDRGLREFPIQPDYFALRSATSVDQRVRVLMEEVDDEDKIILEAAD